MSSVSTKQHLTIEKLLHWNSSPFELCVSFVVKFLNCSEHFNQDFVPNCVFNEISVGTTRFHLESTCEKYIRISSTFDFHLAFRIGDIKQVRHFIELKWLFRRIRKVKVLFIYMWHNVKRMTKMQHSGRSTISKLLLPSLVLTATEIK